MMKMFSRVYNAVVWLFIRWFVVRPMCKAVAKAAVKETLRTRFKCCTLIFAMCLCGCNKTSTSMEPMTASAIVAESKTCVKAGLKPLQINNVHGVVYMVQCKVPSEDDKAASICLAGGGMPVRSRWDSKMIDCKAMLK